MHLKIWCFSLIASSKYLAIMFHGVYRHAEYLEKRPLVSHFREDATNWPDVNGARVLAGSEEDLRGAVPQGHHLVGVDANGYTKGSAQTTVNWAWNRNTAHSILPRQTKIGDFDGSGLVDEKVLWLQVSVKDTSLVTKQDCLGKKMVILYK